MPVHESTKSDDNKNRTNRRFASLLLIQLSSGVSTLVLWALVSRIVEPSDAAIAVQVLTLSMVAFLPLTFGLPYIIPNYYRRDGDELSMVEARTLALKVCCIVSTTAATIAAVLSVCSLFYSGLSITALVLSFAGLLSVGVMLQQLARVNVKIAMMACGTLAAVSLPAFYIIASTAGFHGLGLRVLVGLSLSCVTVILANHIRPSRRLRSASGIGGQSMAWPLFRLSSPMIPHLLAIAVLMQGVRLVSTLSGNHRLTVAAHFLMLFLGVAFGTIQGVHGLLSVTVQTSQSSHLPSRFRRSGTAYGLLGLGASVAVTEAYRLFGSYVFDGAMDLDTPAAISLATVPASFVCYFFLSSICVREGKSGFLAVFSSVAAGALVLASLVITSDQMTSFVVLYATVLVLLQAALIVGLLIVLTDPLRSCVVSGWWRALMAYGGAAVIGVIILAGG